MAVQGLKRRVTRQLSRVQVLVQGVEGGVFGAHNFSHRVDLNYLGHIESVFIIPTKLSLRMHNNVQKSHVHLGA